MPVHLVTRGGRHCVAEPDGKIIESGCYDDRDDALARMAAINMSKIVDNSEQGTANEEEGDFSGTAVPTTSEKEFGISYPATSFQELDEVRDEVSKLSGLKQVISDFMTLAANVFSFPSERGIEEDIKGLVDEMGARIGSAQQASEEKDLDSTGVQADKSMFTVWKDRKTGQYRWLGVYSNKFRDSDNPPEILAEDAHIRFVERVEKGELPYPDLYVWHIPVPIGKADLLAYHDSGFSVASGTVKETFAIALMNTTEDLAMSHGMPNESIRREDRDKSVITDYQSTEVSVLPRSVAANKMTDFSILKEGPMAFIPKDKRQQIEELLGADATEELESGLSLLSDKATADGIEYKEEAEQLEEGADETEGVEQETDVQAGVEGAEEEPVAQSEELDADGVQDADVGAEAVAQDGDGSAQLEKDDVAETLATVVGAVADQGKALMAIVKAMTERLDEIESRLPEKDAPDVSDEGDVEKGAANGTPEASLEALLKERLSGQVSAKSVIGNPATRLHGNSNLAKDGPEQAAHDGAETEEGYAGLFFQNWQ